MRPSCFAFASLGLALLASATSGCTLDRPSGQFKPTKRVTTATMGDPDVFADAGGGNPMNGSNGSIEDPVIDVDQDGGMMVPADSPLAKAQGYYWLRTDVQFTYTQSGGPFVGNVQVFNTVSHMALTQLVAGGQVLKAVERNCHIVYQHKCEDGCSSFTTVAAPDAAKLYRAQDLRRVYSLTNTNTMFVTDTVALLLGWTGPADKLPADLSDSPVWNADGDPNHKGFYINVRASGLPQPVDCYYNTVERFSSSYAGTLKADSLDGVNATLTTTGSQAKTLKTAVGTGVGASTCTPNSSSPPVTRSTVRFVRVAESPTFWTCPSLTDFKAKIADP